MIVCGEKEDITKLIKEDPHIYLKLNNFFYNDLSQIESQLNDESKGEEILRQVEITPIPFYSKNGKVNKTNLEQCKKALSSLKETKRLKNVVQNMLKKMKQMLINPNEETEEQGQDNPNENGYDPEDASDKNFLDKTKTGVKKKMFKHRRARSDVWNKGRKEASLDDSVAHVTLSKNEDGSALNSKQNDYSSNITTDTRKNTLNDNLSNEICIETNEKSNIHCVYNRRQKLSPWINMTSQKLNTERSDTYGQIQKQTPQRYEYTIYL